MGDDMVDYDMGRIFNQAVIPVVGRQAGAP